jgi:hypothetical protein
MLTQGSWRTKELGEKAFLRENSESTIIRPSIIFGPGDSFFNVRLPFLLLAPYMSEEGLIYSDSQVLLNSYHSYQYLGVVWSDSSMSSPPSYLRAVLMTDLCTLAISLEQWRSAVGTIGRLSMLLEEG